MDTWLLHDSRARTLLKGSQHWSLRSLDLHASRRDPLNAHETAIVASLPPISSSSFPTSQDVYECSCKHWPTKDILRAIVYDAANSDMPSNGADAILEVQDQAQVVRTALSGTFSFNSTLNRYEQSASGSYLVVPAYQVHAARQTLLQQWADYWDQLADKSKEAIQLFRTTIYGDVKQAIMADDLDWIRASVMVRMKVPLPPCVVSLLGVQCPRTKQKRSFLQMLIFDGKTLYAHDTRRRVFYFLPSIHTFTRKGYHTLISDSVTANRERRRVAHPHPPSSPVAVAEEPVAPLPTVVSNPPLLLQQEPKDGPTLVDMTCKICMVNTSDIVGVPCGHTLCHTCLKSLRRKTICPFCISPYVITADIRL